MSVFNYQLNTVFIHVPRCAGSSLETILGGQGHKDIIYFKRFFEGQCEGLKFEDLFKFSFVRNPYDRFISCYMWYVDNSGDKMGINDFSQKLSEIYNSWELDSLNELVFRPQWKFICNQYKEIQVDFVGRVENIKDDWNTVRNTLHIDIDLPHINKSKVSDKSKNILDSQSKSIIANLYKDDFALFGYVI